MTQPQNDSLLEDRDNRSHHVEQMEVEEAELPAFKRVLLPTMGMFAGYACQIVLQGKLKSHLDVPQHGDLARAFTFAVSFQYIGNLVFRLAHNFIFGCFTSNVRVVISQFSMMTALAIVIFMFTTKTASMHLVALAYGLSGMAVGSFESNLISAITPLGKETKVWAISGLPLGFCIISVAGFILMGMGLPPVMLYVMTFILNVVGFVVFQFYVPFDVNSNRQQNIIESLKNWGEWMPQSFVFWLALFVDMFFVATFGPVLLYIFNDRAVVPLWNPNDTTWLVNHDLYVFTFQYTFERFLIILFLLFEFFGGGKFVYIRWRCWESALSL